MVTPGQDFQSAFEFFGVYDWFPLASYCLGRYLGPIIIGHNPTRIEPVVERTGQLLDVGRDFAVVANFDERLAVS
jgi:hypothetical protein